ncbi:hypothetical protein Sfulv_04230 [Streptomyces fulvorobeus]|uniref:Uncharacterized protein n=1 Tax=Streptomyces fulvorobeus TaxID=284028 RepID=A0A7J0BZD4_9ACTN|nr:hypothetical protein Sfulv_04230 [Streptomyces fulvorobeus]
MKASAADARTGRFGSGVPSQSGCRTGDGAGCRKVALSQATEQFAVSDTQVIIEGRTEEPGAIRIARVEF